jgi:hypothetical protein
MTPFDSERDKATTPLAGPFEFDGPALLAEWDRAASRDREIRLQEMSRDREIRLQEMSWGKRLLLRNPKLSLGIAGGITLVLLVLVVSFAQGLANRAEQENLARESKEKAAALEQATLVQERELAERTELLASCDSATIKEYASDLELQEGWLLACDDPEVLDIIIELAPQPNCEIKVGKKLSPLEIAAFTKCPEDKRATILAWQGQDTPPRIVALLATDSSPRVRRAVALYSSDPKVLGLIPFEDSEELAMALAMNSALPEDVQDRLIETQIPDVLDALMKNTAVTFLVAQKLVKRPDQALIAVNRFGSTDGGVGMYAGELSRQDAEKIIQTACRTLKPQVPKWEAANDKGYYTLRPFYNVC